MSKDCPPKVVIVGAGFGGLFAAKALSRVPADVILVDRHNYHLFQPLLYQVATAGLAPSDIAWPIRSILTRQRNVSVLLGDVQSVDMDKRLVNFKDERIEFDYLVLATGARHSYFGNDEWSHSAPGLKSINDATAIRRRLEQAESCNDLSERERLLRFLIVAGPTGVELAGAIAELEQAEWHARAANLLLHVAGSTVL